MNYKFIMDVKRDLMTIKQLNNIIRPESVQYLKELTPSEFRQVKTLVQTQCCNYGAGTCLMLDGHCCIQNKLNKVCCSWFRDAVLPVDATLEAEIYNRTQHSIKKCAVCGKTIVSKSNKIKYCNKCAVKIHRKQQLESRRRKRGSSATNRTIL